MSGGFVSATESSLPKRSMEAFTAQLYRWLACEDPVEPADLIFALAGHPARKTHALALFSQGSAPELLLSVGRCEVRAFGKLPLPVPLNLLPLAAEVQPRKRHFFVRFGCGKSDTKLMPKGRLGTLSEIRFLRDWLVAENGLRSVLIVSSGFHLRRVRLCCEDLFSPNLGFRLVAIEGDDQWLHRGSWWRDRRTRSKVLVELAKVLLYWSVFRLRLGRLTRESPAIWRF